MYIPMKHSLVSEEKILEILNNDPMSMSDIALKIVIESKGNELTIENAECLQSVLLFTKNIVWKMISNGVLELDYDTLKVRGIHV